MFRFTPLAAALALAFATASYAQTTTTATAVKSETQYLTRVAPRFGAVAGSDDNLQSLVHGLRTGSTVQLSGATAGDAVTFTPATRPMGYGNITRALDLATRELAAAGIRNPTPQQLDAALNGGTITTANGTTTMTGVLQLRSQGMGWGKIAQTIGVHPGMGKMPASVATTTATTSQSAASVTTAAGGTSSGIVTGAGRSGSVRASPGEAQVESGQGVVTASGAGGASVSGKGITTAAGAISSHGQARAAVVSPGQGVVTAGGASVGNGVVTAGGGHGNGNGVGRGGNR